MGTISVSHLGKAYKQYPHRWARLAEWLLPGMRPRHRLKWVLSEVDFTIPAGESVGIVGVNGAGKSTLLKMIAGTLQPTTGSVQVNGRVAALLELGMGFHPDFTGRQNVQMAGQLLGHRVEEIARLMPDIEAFAGIGDYLDQPVRVYSSGMQVRLAFSVATAVRPDILIVDEALAVGDAAFQRKCFQRIERFRAEGSTLLFVSHNIETVKRLCSQAIFIDQGRIAALGDAKSVCDTYERKLFGKPGNARAAGAAAARLDRALADAAIESQYGDGSATIHDAMLADDNGATVNITPEGAPFAVGYRVVFNRDCRGVKFGMMIKSVEGACIYGTHTEGLPLAQEFRAGEVVNVQFPLQGNLVPGTYYLNVGVTREGEDAPEFCHRRVDTLIFRVVAARSEVSMGHANLFATPRLSRADGHASIGELRA